MTKPKRYKRYSADFKREAILRAGEGGMTHKAVLVGSQGGLVARIRGRRDGNDGARVFQVED